MVAFRLSKINYRPEKIGKKSDQKPNNTQRSPRVGFAHRQAGIEIETVSIKNRCVEIEETPMFFSDIGHVDRFLHMYKSSINVCCRHV